MEGRDGPLNQLQIMHSSGTQGETGNPKRLEGYLAIFIEDLDSRDNLQVQVELLGRRAKRMN